MTVRGADEVERKLLSVADRLKDMTPILQVIAQDTKTLIDDGFQSSTAPDGSPWASQSDTTLQMRARRAAGPSRVRVNLIGPLPFGQSRFRKRKWTKGRSDKAAAAVFGAKPLIDKSRLRNSVTTRVSKTSFTFGTNVVYAAAQHFGNPKNKLGKNSAPIPARPFLPISAEGSRFSLMTGGRSGLHWAEVRAAVALYIRTGAIE